MAMRLSKGRVDRLQILPDQACTIHIAFYWQLETSYVLSCIGERKSSNQCASQGGLCTTVCMLSLVRIQPGLAAGEQPARVDTCIWG
jgi:hypothetical protein